MSLNPSITSENDLQNASFATNHGAIVSRPPAGMTRFVKLLDVRPFSVTVNGVPSGANTSARTVRLLAVVLTIVIVVVHPPPATN